MKPLLLLLCGLSDSASNRVSQIDTASYYNWQGYEEEDHYDDSLSASPEPEYYGQVYETDRESSGDEQDQGECNCDMRSYRQESFRNNAMRYNPPSHQHLEPEPTNDSSGSDSDEVQQDLDQQDPCQPGEATQSDTDTGVEGQAPTVILSDEQSSQEGTIGWEASDLSTEHGNTSSYILRPINH